MDPAVFDALLASATFALKTIPQGAATSVLVATSAQLEGIGGRYFEDCNEAAMIEEGFAEATAGVADYAIDADNAARLWEVSEGLIG